MLSAASMAVAEVPANASVSAAPQGAAVPTDQDLSRLSLAEPEEWRQAVSPEVAAAVTQTMEAVVQDGSGRAAQLPGVRVAGKTGTAQHAPGRPPHAWFIGFAPADDPQVAVAVVIEDGGSLGAEATGGRLAAPVARDVMRAVLRP